MTVLTVTSSSQSFTTDHAGPALAGNRLLRLLDQTSAELARVDLRGMNDFVIELDQIRRRSSRVEWEQMIRGVIAPHPILGQLHQEPFARRAFEKPRGYPGDAPLLDLIYRERPYSVELTRLGAALHAWADGQAGCRSVQERPRILAQAIDDTADRREGARILSLACGHLREAQLSNAVRQGAVAELIALDQDAESLAVVEREQRDFNVVVKRASVRRFVTAGSALGEFDLVYSAGLFDYLNETDAAMVTKAMFRSLRSGGRLLIANFAPELCEIAYMEAFLDWRLIYRDEAAMASLCSDLPAESVASRSMVRDSGGNVVYMTVEKV
jgi:SAM-dependent methyltransferase